MASLQVLQALPPQIKDTHVRLGGNLKMQVLLVSAWLAMKLQPFQEWVDGHSISFVDMLAPLLGRDSFFRCACFSPPPPPTSHRFPEEGRESSHVTSRNDSCVSAGKEQFNSRAQI